MSAVLDDRPRGGVGCLQEKCPRVAINYRGRGTEPGKWIGAIGFYIPTRLFSFASRSVSNQQRRKQ